MKKTFTLFICFLFSFSVFSQQRFETYYNFKGATGQGTFSSYKASLSNDLVVNKDKLLIRGIIEPQCASCPSAEDFILSTDLSGKLLSAIGYTTSDSLSFAITNFTALASGEIVYCGSLEKQLKNDYILKPVVFKTSAAGNVLWAKSLTSKNYEFQDNCLITTDVQGNIYLYCDGEEVSDNHDLTDEIIKLDKNGNVLWQKGVNQNYYDGFNQVGLVCGDNYIYAYGGTDDRFTGEFNRTVLFIFNKANGNLVAGKQYFTYTLQGQDGQNGVSNAYVQGGILYLFGTTTTYGSDLAYKFLLKIKDTTADKFARTCLIDKIAIQRTLQQRNALPLTIFTPGTGSIAYFNNRGAKYQFSSYAYDSIKASRGIYLTKTDTSGRLCQETVIQPTPPSTPNVIVQTVEAFVFLVNDTVVANNVSIKKFNYQVTDSVTCSVKVSNSIASKSNSSETLSAVSSLKLTPNPATNYINVSFVVAKTGNARISIYNLTGKLIKQQSILCTKGSNTASVEVNQLNPGLYSVKLITEADSQTANFIKQ